MQSLQRSFSEKTIRHPNDWILTEVDYLVKLAASKLWIEQDVKTSIALLLAADQRTVELNDASPAELRRALLADITTLEALPKRDPDSLILKLSNLELQVPKLKTAQLTMPEPALKAETDLSSDVNDWQGNLEKSWATFVNNFVLITHRDQAVKALLKPEQVWLLKARLRADSAKAEFAV